jgi:hypothetical protein
LQFKIIILKAYFELKVLVVEGGGIDGRRRYGNERGSRYGSGDGSGVNDLGPYPSYPPPLPLWALNRPRRKFEPYFGLPVPENIASNQIDQVELPPGNRKKMANAEYSARQGL